MTANITFIIPIYNGHSYLVEAIESILKQTDTNWNLLLIDDGSTDNSQEIIKSYVDEQITAHYNNENLGLYGTLLNAVNLVKSDWIVILMQDDRLKPSYLHEMKNLINKYPKAQAFWATEDTIDEAGNLLLKGKNTCRIEAIKPGVDSWFSILKRGCIWTISGSLTRQDLLLANPFKTNLPHCGDYEWLLRNIRRTSFVYYEKSLTEIRIHSQQASAINLKIGKDIEESYEIIKTNFLDYTDDLSLFQVIVISSRRVNIISYRFLTTMLIGRFYDSAKLFWYLLKFLQLPFIYIQKAKLLNTKLHING